MAYNLTGIQDSENLFTLFTSFNTTSGNLLLYGTLITLWIVLFMVLLKRNPPQESFLASSLVSGIVSLMFFAAGTGGSIMLFLIGFVVMTVASAISLYTGR